MNAMYFILFFYPKVKVGTLGNDLLYPMLRLCESLCQNNECPVESIISIFQSQAFRGQHKETSENRAFIKCNRDTISGGQKFCRILANMSVNGIPEWGIDKLTLPIRYGRYENGIAKSFARIQSLKGSKFEYIYKCKGEGFTHRMKQIGSTFKELKRDLAEERDDI